MRLKLKKLRPPSFGRLLRGRRQKLTILLTTTTTTAAAATMLCRLSPVSKSDSSTDNTAAFILRRFLVVVVFISTLSFLYRSTDSLRSLTYLYLPDAFSSSFNSVFPSQLLITEDVEHYSLEKVLKDTATQEKTVIITTSNEAWAAPGSILDLFLHSFRIGEHTRRLLNHLVIVCLDQTTYRRCLKVHRHCFALVNEGVHFSTEAYFMTPDYLNMMWRRIDFLRSVLELGYNFVFTDADIMWFRNPFPRFDLDSDFQIACDHFSGDPVDLENKPNGGFNYVKSNKRSVEFYKFWLLSRDKYPGHHDQDVLNFIKYDPYIADIGLKMRFLDTAYFGGFCEPSEDLNQVCTMHANCCFGMHSKLYDLRIMLQDWRLFMSLPPALKRSQVISWRVPNNCSLDALHGPSAQ